MIINNFTHPVIEVDDRDPDVSWTHHKQRGSLGGVDLAYPYGTTVVAPATGTVKNLPNTGSGGNTVQIHMSDGSYIELMHLSKFLISNGRTVTAGEKVAESGASGFGQANHYAAHLHTHLVLANGQRVNLFHYFTSTAAVGGTLPIASDAVKPQLILKEDDMLLIITKAGNYYAYLEKIWKRVSRDRASVIRDAMGITVIPELSSAAAKMLFAITAEFVADSIKADNRDVDARLRALAKQMAELDASVDEIPDATVDALAGRIS